MNTNLLNIVKQIITDYGEAVLADPQRLKAFFGDLAKDEPKPLRVAFGRCIEAGAYTALKTASDRNERAERKAAITQRVFDEHGIAESLCAEALDILEAALPEEKTGSVDLAEAQPEEIDDLQKKLTQKNEELIRCIQTIGTLTSEKQQKEAALNKTKTGLKCAIVLGILAAAISIGVGISQYNNAMTDYNNKYDEYNELEQRYSSLQSEMNKLSADYNKRSVTLAEAEHQAAVAEAQRKAESERQAAVTEAQRKAESEPRSASATSPARYTEVIYVEGSEPLQYILSNNAGEIERAIYTHGGKRVNLDSLNWFVNTVLSQNVKAAMNRLNVNYSYPLGYGIVNKRVGNKWYSAYLWS